MFQPDGGFLLAERSMRAHFDQAAADGADLRFEEPVLAWQPLPTACASERRGTYEADRLVIAAGAWVRSLVPALADLAMPERQVLGWFTRRVADLRPGPLPGLPDRRRGRQPTTASRPMTARA